MKPTSFIQLKTLILPLSFAYKMLKKSCLTPLKVHFRIGSSFISPVLGSDMPKQIEFGCRRNPVIRREWSEDFGRGLR